MLGHAAGFIVTRWLDWQLGTAAQTDLVEVLGEFRPRIVKMCPEGPAEDGNQTRNLKLEIRFSEAIFPVALLTSDFGFFLTNLPLGKPEPLTSLIVPERTPLPAPTGRDARDTFLSPVYE